MDFKLEGTKEFIEAMDALSEKELHKIIKTVERKDLTQNIIKPIRAALPYSAKTKKGIKIVADKEFKETGLFAGASTDVFWLRFLEKGTVERKGRGKITPRPIIAPVIEGNISAVVEFFNKDFGEWLDKTISRKLKRINK